MPEYHRSKDMLLFPQLSLSGLGPFYELLETAMI